MRRLHGCLLATVVCALGFTPACSSPTGNGTAGALAACDDYFAAAESCLNVLPPAGEIAREKARFETLCTGAMSLPGTGLTANALEACVAAIHTGGCSVQAAQTGPCALQGTLGASAICAANEQCASGQCNPTASSADGGTATCGTCAALTPVGQPCSLSNGLCVANAACVGSGSSTMGTCVAIAQVGAGASCTGPTPTQCTGTLVCNASSVCAVPGAAGAACMADSDCAAPLVCPPSLSVCHALGTTGESCVVDAECIVGLACNTTTSVCGTVTWVSAEQPCGGSVRCLVGLCDGTSGAGTCPTVIADGQPCTESSQTSGCDTFSNCTAGRCTLGVTACH